MKNIKNSTVLNIGWLYPDLMSTYGDRGNIIALTKRCEWREIDSTIIRIDQETSEKEISTIDLLFGGGAQDMEQDIVMRDLRGKKADAIKKHVESDKPALFVCGAPQLMGQYYEPAVGRKIEGLGIFDMVSENPGPKHPRLIGNVVASVNWDALSVDDPLITKHSQIVGFENHGGRTRLGHAGKPFAKIIKGFGNNGEDKTEGVVYKNAIGCYLHGPILPKNPQIADFLIKRALEVKYKEPISLTTLDDSLEWRAHNAIVKRLGVSV